MAYYLPVSSAEMTAIQADAAIATLSLPCQIQRKTMILDGMGQATETFTTISSPNLKCGMSIPSANALQNWDFLIGTLSAWHVKLPVNTDVAPQDHLIVTDSRGITQRLVVQVILQPQSYQALMGIIASEIKQS